jgi:hypothetical protein
MKLNRAILLPAAVLVFAFSVAAHAQSHEAKTGAKASSLSLVQLGDKLIVIPAPEGYEEASSQFPGIKERFTLTEAPENDMLFVHMPRSDCELLRNGSKPTYDQYTKISVVRAGRTVTVTRPMMALAVDGLRKSAATFLDPDGPQMKELERHVARGLSQADARETKIDFGKPVMLGEFNVKPDVFSMLLLLTIKGSVGGVETTTPMLLSVSYVRVRDRLIFVYGYRSFKSKVDVEPIKLFTEKWTNSIVAANSTP